jgi:hypothetical protein
MTYKAYIDTIKAKTGKDPEYYRAEASKLGLTKYGELPKWLKSDCGLGPRPPERDDPLHSTIGAGETEDRGGREAGKVTRRRRGKQTYPDAMPRFDTNRRYSLRSIQSTRR